MRQSQGETKYSEQEQNDLWHRRFDALRRRRQQSFATDLVPRSEDRFIVFRCGAHRFALPLQSVTEVVPLSPGQSGTLVPGASAEFWGLLLVRGEVCPVFDANPLLSLPTAHDGSAMLASNGHIVFIRSIDRAQDTDIVGLKVDRVENVVTLSEKDAHLVGEGGAHKGRFVQSLQTDDAGRGSLLFLDVNALLTYLRGGTLKPSGELPPPESQTISKHADTRRLPGVEKE